MEWSLDGVTFFRTCNKSVSGAAVTNTLSEDTLAVSASILLWIDTFPPQAPYFRVNVKRTGGSGTDKIAITALIANP